VPSPGRILAAAGSRLRGARYAVEDAVFLGGRFVGRLPRALWRGLRGFWLGLTGAGRQRLLAALGVVVAGLLIWSLAVPNLPCQLPGGDSCPPADDAEDLVPSDALAYVHVNLDHDTDQYDHAAEVAASLPTITDQVATRALALLPGPGGGPPNFVRDIEPWFSGEAAAALLPRSGDGSGVVELLEISDPERAMRFAAKVATKRPRVRRYRDVDVSVGGGGIATAQIGGFLAIGSEADVRAVIDTQTGAKGAKSLADDDAAEAARGALPDHRLLEAYVSAEGAKDLIAPSAPLGALAPLISPDATRGAAAALAADDGELELSVRSELNPDRARSRAGFFAAFPPFDPTLAGELGTDSLAYLGIGDPERAVKALLTQASAQAPGIAAGFQDLIAELRRSDEIDVEGEFLPAIGDEAAFALAPRPGAEDLDPTPYLQFIADGVDEERARKALARLQRPVAAAIEPEVGLEAPSFQEVDVGDVQARSLRVSPAIDLTYAVFDGLATIATDPAGIADLAEGDGGLDGTDRFERATEDLPDEPSLLGYLDLGDLISIGEQLGLAENPAYATFAGEFRTLNALGLTVRSDEDALATDARLLVEPPPDESAQSEAEAPPSD
jgi:hypothetical protein